MFLKKYIYFFIISLFIYFSNLNNILSFYIKMRHVAYSQLLDEDQRPKFQKKLSSNFQTIAGDSNPGQMRCLTRKVDVWCGLCFVHFLHSFFLFRLRITTEQRMINNVLTRQQVNHSTCPPVSNCSSSSFLSSCPLINYKSSIYCTIIFVLQRKVGVQNYERGSNIRRIEFVIYDYLYYFKIDVIFKIIIEFIMNNFLKF